MMCSYTHYYLQYLLHDVYQKSNIISFDGFTKLIDAFWLCFVVRSPNAAVSFVGSRDGIWKKENEKKSRSALAFNV